MSSLNSRSVGAFARALKLKRDASDGDFAESLLSEITQFSAVQYGGRRVKGFGFDLYRIFEVDVKRVARTVRKEIRVVLGEYSTQSLEFDFDVVRRGSAGRPVKTESDDEYPFVDGKLYAITSAPVAPLIIPIRARLKPMTYLKQTGKGKKKKNVKKR